MALSSNDLLKAAVRILIPASERPANISSMKNNELINKLQEYIDEWLENNDSGSDDD